MELYRNLPSRLHSISYYQDIGNAMRYCQFGRDNTHIVLSVTPDKQCRQFDENWFKQITTSSNYDEVTELAKGYWSGKMTPNRIIEVLVTGKYEFLRKGLNTKRFSIFKNLIAGEGMMLTSIVGPGKVYLSSSNAMRKHI